MEGAEGSQSPEIKPQIPIAVSEPPREHITFEKDCGDTFTKEDASRASEAIMLVAEVDEGKDACTDVNMETGYKCDHCDVLLPSEEAHAEHIKAHLLEAAQVAELSEGGPLFLSMFFIIFLNSGR